MRTGITAYKKQILYFLFLALPLSLFGQAGERRTVAVIPFWGDNDTIITEFGEEVLEGVDNLQVGRYRSTPIDMTNLPDDVPEGGYPPNICPSPSLTREHPFALTGEISEDLDNDGWEMRLYLWMMDGTKLVYSDRLTAADRETCNIILPGLLEWIFSFIPTDTDFQMTAGANKVVYYAPGDADKWLYVSLRGGPAIKLLAKPNRDAINSNYPEIDKADRFGKNWNIAVSAAWMLPDTALFTSPLGVQAEGIFVMDLSEDFKEMSFIFPLMLRYHAFRKGTAAITVLGGAYMGLPLSGDILYYSKKLWGITAGVNFGNKVGPGYVYLDLRWLGDLTNSYSTATGHPPPYPGYRRNLISITVGYEMGFINKR